MMARRALLMLVGGCLAWLGVRPSAVAVHAEAARLLDSLLPSRAPAQAIGTAVLRAGSAEPSVQALLQALQRQQDGPIDAGSIRAQIRDDFAQGRIVDVEGWMLSATEARLCALAALT
jgi:murein L,D-transpeptidase YcbB/YkuD